MLDAQNIQKKPVKIPASLKKYKSDNPKIVLSIFGGDRAELKRDERKIAKFMHEFLGVNGERKARADAKKKYAPRPDSPRVLITSYLEKNPFSTVRQISEGIGREYSATHRMLGKLRKEGRAKNVMRKTPTNTRSGVSRAGFWFLTEAQQ